METLMSEEEVRSCLKENDLPQTTQPLLCDTEPSCANPALPQTGVAQVAAGAAAASVVTATAAVTATVAATAIPLAIGTGIIAGIWGITRLVKEILDD
ncbi:Hypothetical protein LUCI_2575 [Lucifera butyrica]|uniref:Uncharacterized protein n=1 Tax=Lucifera butyrica TaxID=1351585 RepID=A0A498R7H5_9FIRM|nr:hypothetical protein [Lucifera butyrica]VBB07331.1 Hypothetical protein LUCI_2575 [Lucifera butyrica]